MAEAAPGYVQLTFPQAPESLFHTHEEYTRERARPRGDAAAALPAACCGMRWRGMKRNSMSPGAGAAAASQQ
jgi:hypothetical protein